MTNVLHINLYLGCTLESPPGPVSHPNPNNLIMKHNFLLPSLENKLSPERARLTGLRSDSQCWLNMTWEFVAAQPVSCLKCCNKHILVNCLASIPQRFSTFLVKGNTWALFFPLVLFWSFRTTSTCIFLLHRQINFMRSFQWWNTLMSKQKLIVYLVRLLLIYYSCVYKEADLHNRHTTLRYTTHARVVKGPIYRSSWTRGAILSCSNCSSGEATDVSQIFTWLLALFWSPPTTENNLLDLLLQMFGWAATGQLRWSFSAENGVLVLLEKGLLREVNFIHMVTLNVHLHPKQQEKQS